MSENKILEITELMRQPDNFRNDINEATRIISEHFRKKYIYPIEQEIKICSEEFRREPTSEISLLEACRPFVKNNERLDTFISVVTGMNVINRVMNTTVEAKSTDSSIHSDGIYDIDENCRVGIVGTGTVSGINPIVIALLFLIFE